jgi:hypothetical protein
VTSETAAAIETLESSAGEKRMPEIGDINGNGQRLVEKTALAGNHRFAKRWVIECAACGCRYGANSCDFHIRKCPEPHGGGKPGLPVAD